MDRGYRKIPPAAEANQITGKARNSPAHELKKINIGYLPFERPVLKNVLPKSQKRPETEGRGTLLRQGENIFHYFFICACLLIFFDFLQSDWLQQRAAFYDILTVVQKCYFFTNRQA